MPNRKPPRKRGGPRYNPTDDQRQLVRVLASNGIAQRIIAEVLDISENTVRRAFRQECANGFHRVRAAVGAAVVKSALSGNVAAQKFWLLTHDAENWKMPKYDADDVPPYPGADAADGADDSAEPWVIMMPENGRDQPDAELDEGPIIEGEAEAA